MMFVVDESVLRANILQLLCVYVWVMCVHIMDNFVYTMILDGNI